MRRIVTSEDILALLREGKTEVMLGEEDQMTDIVRELIKKHGLRVIREEELRRRQLKEEREKVRQDAQPASPQAEYAVREAPVYKAPAVSAALKPEYDLIVKNGTVVLPEMGCIRVNVCVKDRKIAALTTQAPSAGQEIDASDLYVMPGIIDPHTHLGLYAPLEKELETESRSAILGGVTTIGTFFNHTGSYLPTIDMLEQKVPALSRVDMIPHFTLREDVQLRELGAYSARGMNSFKMYMCGVPGLFPNQEDGFILRAMRYLKQLDADPIVCIHAENASIVDFATEDMKKLSVETLEEWARSHPNLAEGEAVIRAAYFAQKMDMRTYIVHTSCRESMEALKRVKHKKLFAETTSPYLTLDTSSDIGIYGKMLPPFREPESRQSLWEAIREGRIDTIGTDNVTMTRGEKKVAEGMDGADAGYPALGTHLASVLDEGFYRQEIPIEKLVPLMTMNPAKIFGVYPLKGTLMPGADADIVLVDMRCGKTADPAELESRSDFSLFQGKTLRAWPCGTIKGGSIAAWNRKLTDDAAMGKILKH